MIANAPMRELLRRGADLAEIFVPSPFQMLVAGGFVEVDGCVFFRELFHHDSLTMLATYQDRTGYECSVNAIHLEDYLEAGMAREPPALAMTAVRCVDWLAGRLRSRFPADEFLILVSVRDDRTCTLRFHKARVGESWVVSDLDRYEEAVLVSGTNRPVPTPS